MIKCQFKGCQKRATQEISMLLKQDIYMCDDHVFLFCKELEDKVGKLPIHVVVNIDREG